MLQSFEYKGSLVRLEWASDGRLVFSDIIETFISKSCKDAVFEAIPNSNKRITDQAKITTPRKMTLDLLCNPPEYFGNTDIRLMDGRILAGTIDMFLSGKIPCSNIPINIRIPPPENIAYIARLVSTGGQFKLDDFAHNIYPDKIT